jgi:hypothetical protein
MQNQNESNCPICGERSYSWGIVQAQEYLKYKSDDAGFLEKWTGLGGESVRARKCNSCGNLQLFASEG